MRTIIHVGPDHAESSSRRYVLRAAGFRVIAVSERGAVERLVAEHGADLVVLEPTGAHDQEVSDQEVSAASTADVAIVDLNFGWDALAKRSRGSELTLAVCALLRLNATEQALRESDARFRSVADAAPVLIWSSTTDRLRDYCNQSWLHFTGRAPEQELGEGWAQGIHPEDYDRCLSAYRSAFDERSDFEVEYRLRYRDGNYRWLLERGVPRYTPDGIFAGYAGSCIDITERKNVEAERERLLRGQVAQRELAQANERRSALLAEISDLLSGGWDSMPALETLASRGVPLLGDCCVIHLLDAQGSLKVVGSSCGSAQPSDAFLEYVSHPRINEHPNDPVVQAVKTGKPTVMENLTRSAMGRPGFDSQQRDRLEALSAHALFVVPLIAFGERLGALSFLLLDPARRFVLADLHLAQEIASRIALGLRNRMLFLEAESARRQAEEAGRVKDEFLATISHELRQPVHAINGWVRLLKTGKLPQEKAAHAMQVIEQNVALQAQIVKDLLDVSAMITGQLYLEPQPIALAPIISAAVESVRAAADAKSIELRAELDAQPRLLSGDAKRLQQVVWNLLYNAIKFTPRDGTVEVALLNAGYQAQITVTDNGPGIDAQFLPHVFDHFRQQDSTTTRKYGGLGLGLAIVRHVVELHGGQVRAQNVSGGRGAMFVVTLPYERVPAAQPVRAVVDRA
jgi:PAS domain S-box-containing protein